jgi:NAD+-dependent secondary alcohol dehydrogenase Adh1
MKAVRVHEYNRPPSLDEVPQPDLASHNDVLVRVGGSGVCRTDLHVIDGWFIDHMPVEAPFTLGHETAGWIEAIGRDVTKVKVGDPVIVHPQRSCGICAGCRSGEDMYCTDSSFPGLNADGGYAEYLRTTQRALVPLAEGTDPALVAPYADAGITAYRAVRKAAAILQPGHTVVVLGVGGLGHIAIQLLRAMTPARVIGVDPAERGRALAMESGADEVLDLDDAVVGVTEATGGLGADVIIDFVGEKGTPELAVQLVKQGGTYLIVGYGGDLKVPTIDLILKEVTITGNLVGNYTDLSELMALEAASKVKLQVVTYSLDDALKALDDLDNGRIKGRAVLTPNAK